MYILQLFRINNIRRSRERTACRLVLRERDNVPDRIHAGKQHHKTIETERDAAVWRRAEFQRFKEEPEPELRFLIRDVQHFKYLIKYEDLPEELRWSFYDDEENCRRMAKKEILFWSKDKEACEAYLAAKKYNL